MKYYSERQHIAQIDKNGNIVGEVEKWEAHKKGILHRAFTVALIYQNQFILQHRKHPAFDAFFDLTSSSHQLFLNGILQNSLEAIYQTLEREWGIKQSDLISVPKQNGEIYYSAEDAFSPFKEHELCEIWSVALKKIPSPNFDFAYGYSLATQEELKRTDSELFQELAPWVKSMIEQEMI